VPSLPLTPPAILLLAFGALLAISVLFSRASARTGVPLTLVFLGIGMLAGSEGLGGIAFGDYDAALWLGTVALTFILFDGGLNTSVAAMRGVLAPSITLATLGVVLTAGALAVLGHAVGLHWSTAWMIGAIMSSTDAAAVFSVLRASGVHLKRRVGMTLELESGLNDPVAVIVTAVVLTALSTGSRPSPLLTAMAVVMQLGIGALAGIAVGRAARWIMRRFVVRPSGLVPAFTIATASLAYALPALMDGSGFLSVYLAGIVLGSERLPYHHSVQRVHDTLAWLSQIGMFLVLGLLVFPSRVVSVAGAGVGLALVLAFIARPLAVTLCLTPFGYRWRDIAFISLVGLRGAVPIVLATLPVIMRVPRAEYVFDVVFIMVVANALLQGAPVPWLSHRLRVDSAEAPMAPALLEIEGPSPFDREIRSYAIDEALPICGAAVASVPLPDGVAMMLVIRETQLLTPTDGLVLAPGDHVYVLVAEGDIPIVQLLFGSPESG
jgi:cell volume regulation protein A